MAIFKLSDFISSLRASIVNSIQEKYPEIDTNVNSTFDDMSVKPMIEAVMPIIDVASLIDATSIMREPEVLSFEAVNRWAMSNYSMERDGGKKASTTVTVSLTKVPDVDMLTIPTNTAFATGAGLTFLSQAVIKFSASEIASKYNAQTLTYDLDIFVEAQAAGVSYNVSENQITVLLTEFPSSELVVNVTNKIAASGGVDYESNTDYVNRVKNYYISRYPNTEEGYTSDLFDNFPEVDGSLVVGYRDPDMTRDVIGGKHIGGKVDIYISGSLSETIVATVPVNSRIIKLASKYADTSDVSVDNLTEPVRTVVFTVSESSDGFSVITIDDAAGSYDPDKRNEIRVSYSEAGDPKVETYVVEKMSYPLSSPASTVLSVVKGGTSEKLPTSSYTVEHRDVDGLIIPPDSVYYLSSQDDTSILFTGVSDDFYNGETLDITYTFNSTVREIGDFYGTDRRIITVDVLVRESPRVPINIKFVAHLKKNILTSSDKISAITNSVSKFFTTVGIGFNVKESDVVGYLYADPSVSEWLNYIELPFKAFYVPEDVTTPVEDLHPSSNIDVYTINVGSLNKIEVILETS